MVSISILFLLSFCISLSSSHVAALEPLEVKVYNYFRDGRQLAVLGFSKQGRTTMEESLVTQLVSHRQSAGWQLRDYDAETVQNCYLHWRHSTVSLFRFEFEAFLGSWHHHESLREPVSGFLEYAYMVNEDGLFLFNFTARRYRLKKSLSSVTLVSVPITVMVGNAFTDLRIVAISCYSIMRTNENDRLASQALVHGGFVTWIVRSFDMSSVHTCHVGWSSFQGDQVLEMVEFEAFNGIWQFDESIRNPLTGKLTLDYVLIEDGFFLYNFITSRYELKRSLNS